MIAPWLALAVRAAEPADAPAEEVVVEGELGASTSARSLDRVALEALPGRTADELLRAMPGLHLSAHGGRGKAYQFFLRGFDAVHGGDLAVSIEGVPLNEVSHVHAHGYLDLQLLPTVLVRRLDLWPGAARVDVGDFATAGSADFGLGLERGGGLLALTLGSDRSALVSLAWRPDAAPPGTFVVAEGDVGAGVGASRGWRQVRAGAGYEVDAGGTTLRAWALGAHGAFASPGVLREDDLAAGRVGFYDAYPGSGGGVSTRVLGALQASGGGRGLAWRASVHGGWRALALQQNFTGWFTEPELGDGTRQHHEAWTAGAEARVGWAPGDVFAVRGGLAARVDGLEQRVDQVAPDGAVGVAGSPARALQADLGAWASVPLTPTPWLRVEPGARVEAFFVDREDAALAWAPAIAPKLSVSLFEGAVASGFASYGRGLRSPDARGIVRGGRAPVATVDGVELGVAARPAPWASVRAAGFATFVSDEIVFDHVTARYLATGTTRRLGVDGGLSLRPVRSLRVDAELTWADGRYVDTRAPIPYAPRVLGSVGVYLERLRTPGAVLTAGLRAWALGPRPLTDGYRSTPAVVADLTARVEVVDWLVTLDVDNLFATRWRDGEFVYASRWDPDGPLSELPERHLTAGAPFAARLGVGWRF